jgi:hypothetical protein
MTRRPGKCVCCRSVGKCVTDSLPKLASMTIVYCPISINSVRTTDLKLRHNDSET